MNQVSRPGAAGDRLAGNLDLRVFFGLVRMDRQPMFEIARSLLLALLLLLGQAGLILHQIDFDQHTDVGSCAECLAAHGFDHAITAQFTPWLHAAAAELPVAAIGDSPVFPPPAFRLARSPPARIALS